MFASFDNAFSGFAIQKLDHLRSLQHEIFSCEVPGFLKELPPWNFYSNEAVQVPRERMVPLAITWYPNQVPLKPLYITAIWCREV